MILAWLRTRIALQREIETLKQQLRLANEEIAGLKEQRETYRETLAALKWEKIAEGAQAKVFIETLKGAK